LRYLAKESKATYSCTQRSREKQLRDLMDQCALVEDELAIEQRATTMQQEFLQRKLAALSEKSLDVQTKNDKDSNDKTKLLEQLTEEQTVNKERLFDLEKKYLYDVNTRAAKAEEERRMLELQVSACACVFLSTFCVCQRASTNASCRKKGCLLKVGRRNVRMQMYQSGAHKKWSVRLTHTCYF
jgi:hypothetical protein